VSLPGDNNPLERKGKCDKAAVFMHQWKKEEGNRQSSSSKEEKFSRDTRLKDGVSKVCSKEVRKKGREDRQRNRGESCPGNLAGRSRRRSAVSWLGTKPQGKIRALQSTTPRKGKAGREGSLRRQINKGKDRKEAFF